MSNHSPSFFGLASRLLSLGCGANRRSVPAAGGGRARRRESQEEGEERERREREEREKRRRRRRREMIMINKPRIPKSSV